MSYLFNPIKPLAALTAFLSMTSLVHADYSKHPLAADFVTEMVEKHGFAAADVEALLTRAEKRQPILDAISRPAEKAKPWKEYRPIFIVPMRITNGAAFWREHADVLANAEKAYGVPAEIIVSIIGVETNYGRNMGSWSVLDALTTLAFDYPPRAPFFRSELVNYLNLTRQQQQDPLKFKGSYAGAMGYGQFMPSSYLNYAVDFDGDGITDIWNNTTDAIGSVANYFNKHGWKYGEPVVVPAKLNKSRDQLLSQDVFNKLTPLAVSVGEWKKRGIEPVGAVSADTLATPIEFDGANGLEYWLGFQNFYTITRYNRSAMYAKAVYDLSLELKKEMEKSPQ